MTVANIEIFINSFVERYQKLMDETVNNQDYIKNNPKARRIVSVEYGRVYAREVATEFGTNRSALGFIHLSTGDVLKAAGWKAPAKGRRGNLCDSAHGLARADWTGIR